MPALLTANEVAARLRVSARTVRAWAESGRLLGQKVGQRLWRFDPSTVEQFKKAAEPSNRNQFSRITAGEPIRTWPSESSDASSVSLILGRLFSIGFSQKEIAFELRVQRSTVSKWNSPPHTISGLHLARLRHFEKQALRKRLTQLLCQLPIRIFALQTESTEPFETRHIDAIVQSVFPTRIDTPLGSNGLVASIDDRLFLVIPSDNTSPSQAGEICEALLKVLSASRR
jgi:excisionase family DNA binding protein